MIEVSTLISWCRMKIAACDQECEMAKLVGMGSVAAPFANDARYFRAIVDALSHATKQAPSKGTE